MKENNNSRGFKLDLNDYKIVLPLLHSQNELSVLSVIEGTMPGDIYVNDMEIPTTALIQTCECNLIAGSPNNQDFNEFIGKHLDFWDSLTPDTSDWCDVIPRIHQDKYIKKYTRHHYLLERCHFKNCNSNIPAGYALESVEPKKLRTCGYDNADQVLEWMENWGDDETFKSYGVGTYLRNENTIVSWSLSDCANHKNIAIGIQTDENYRKKGFGKLVASETVRQCFQKGYERIEWLCVACNRGSMALATGLGFHLTNTYHSFAPYAPIENIKDLSESQWEEWAQYFEQASKKEPRLLQECIYTYVKANNPQKVKELLLKREDKKSMEDEISGFVSYLHGMGMATRF